MTQVQTVYGRMVEPHTGEVFDRKPSELLKMTPWIQSQIDAGKISVVKGEPPSKPTSVPKAEVPVKKS